MNTKRLLINSAQAPLTLDDFAWHESATGPQSFWVDIGPYLEHLGAVPLVDRDAVWLATAVFLADRTVDRPDSWERQLEIIVPSSNPEAWNAVGAEIEELLKFLTSDEWNVTFFQHESSTHKSIRSEGPAQVVSDLVCLFSGGADSLCAAVKALAEGHNVTLVSHWDDKGQRGIQKLLLADLERLFGEIPHVSVNLGRKRKHHEGASYQNEVSRRSRSLLFITLGLAVASARSKVPLWIGENGFVSLNPPLAPERRAAHSTRTTHPAFLRHLRKILRAVGAHTDFVPIYAGVTKGEMFMSVSDTIGRENASALLSHTHSCSHLRMAMNYGRASTTQCGVCLGCLVRRGAFIASGLEDQSTYLVNDLDQERLGKFLRSTPGADIETMRSAVHRRFGTSDTLALDLPEADVDLIHRGFQELALVDLP